MRQDAWRAYLDMALGMTEASRKTATKAVRQILGKGGATAEQLQGLAEELLRASTANRDSLSKLVRFELDRALGRVGLATAEEVAELTTRLRQLEDDLRQARGGKAGSGASRAATEPAGAEPKPRKKAVKKAVREAVPPAAPAVAKPVAAKPVVATKAVAKKAVAKKAVAKKAVATKATAPLAKAATPVTRAVAVRPVAKKVVARRAGGSRS